MAVAQTWVGPVPPTGLGTETPMVREARSTDASRISLPIQMAAVITVAVLSVGGLYWSVERRIDLIIQKIDSAAELAKERNDNQRSQIDSIRDEQKSQRGKQDLLQLQIQQLQLDMATLKGKR